MNLAAELKAIVGEENILADEILAPHTTFKVGGPCRLYIMPRSFNEVAELVKCLRKHDMPYIVLGNGSNVLVSDKGFDGAVISFGHNMSAISVEGNCITAEAGAVLPKVAATALAHNLSGLEFATGIPGSIGGACLMNAGAYGGEIINVIKTVTALCPDGEIRSFGPDEIDAGYRHSMFMTDRYVVLSAVLELIPGDAEIIKAKMDEYLLARRTKQPLEFPSAGSTFKRPVGDFAGRLIEAAGLKGRGVGDACVSEKHAGFVINKGAATAQDIYDTIKMVKEEVQRNSEVELECEIRMFGDFA